MDRKGGFVLLKRFHELALKHIQGNIVIYFFVIMFFLIGISAGAFTVKSLSEVHIQELIRYIDGFFNILTDRNIDEFSILKQSLSNNLQISAMIWILGVTIIGIPLIILLITIRGFIIGFTVGFLSHQLGFKGALFSFLAILPQNIFIIPSILVIGVLGIGFSTMLIRNKLKKNYHRNENTFKQFILYSTIIFFICLFISIGSLIEAYISPVFMKLLSSYM